MVSIKDIAKKAKVSVATVSHVINNTRFVSDKLRNDVLKAIEKFDYQPNILAGSLRSKHTSTIGFICPDTTNMLFAEISKRIEDIFFSKNYNTIFCNSGYDSCKELEIINTLRTKRVDGIIIVPVDRTDINIKKLASSGIHTIILDRKIPRVNLPSIVIDNEKGTYEATKYLLELGHRDIGYIDRKTPHSHSIGRLKGYKKALKERGLDIINNLVVKGGFRYEDSFIAMKEFFKKKPTPTAVITFNDTAAIGAMRAIIDYGLKIPQDISIIGFDDVKLCEYIVPRLTSIHYPVEEVVEVTTNVLLSKIQKSNIATTNEFVISPKLVIRESTGPVN